MRLGNLNAQLWPGCAPSPAVMWWHTCQHHPPLTSFDVLLGPPPRLYTPSLIPHCSPPLQALDHDGLRDLITRAYAVADAEDGDDEEGGGGGGGGGRSALQDLVRVAAAWWQHGHSRDYQRCLIRVLSRSCPGLQQPLALMLCVPAPAHTAGPAH